MKVLVFCEQRNSKLKTSALEALSVATELSGGKAEDVAAVVIGKSIASLCAELKNYGANTVFTLDHEVLAHYNVLHYTQALAQAVDAFKPSIVIGSASAMGRDLFARSAARLDAGLITDVTKLEMANGECVGGMKPMFAGKVLASVHFQGSGLKMLTIRPNVFAVKTGVGTAENKTLTFVPKETSFKTLEIVAGKSTKADLTEASRIISGGRSLASLDNFKILFECADTMQASVGASRAAVDAGYATHDMQVGQTGKTVNPNLYIACGLSGSIQHMAGMRTSKFIVSINTDPEAPIFSITDYGIVADLFEAVPLLTKKLQALLK